MRTHWKQIVNPDFIGAYSLPEGNDLVVQIDTVSRELVTGNGGQKDECIVAKLVGQKPFIVNSTNAKMITKIAGTPYVEEWKGLKITLYVSTTMLKGEEVECLRIRPTAPKLPVLLLTDTVNFEKVKRAVANGYTLKDIERKWDVPIETQKALDL